MHASETHVPRIPPTHLAKDRAGGRGLHGPHRFPPGNGVVGAFTARTGSRRQRDGADLTVAV